MSHRNDPRSVNDELFRLRTFSSYTGQCFGVKLARAGFYCSSSHDVKCYLCDFSKNDWVYDDKPLDIHRNASPNCSFFRRNEQVNVPVSHKFKGLMRYATEMVGRGGVINDHPSTSNRGLIHGVPAGTPLGLATPQANFTSDGQNLEGNSGLGGRTIDEIVRENRELRRRVLCELCQTNRRCEVFMPCGHLITCSECASCMEQKCPICRHLSSYTVEVNFAQNLCLGYF